jgi:hypothetical protein
MNRCDFEGGQGEGRKRRGHDHRGLQGVTRGILCHLKDPSVLQACVKESISRGSGCKLPWDSLSSQIRRNCSTVEEFRYRGGLLLAPKVIL